MNNPLVDQIISSYRVDLKWSLVSRELNIEPTKLYRIRKQYDIDKIFEKDDDLIPETTALYKRLDKTETVIRLTGNRFTSIRINSNFPSNDQGVFKRKFTINSYSKDDR